MSHVYRFQRWEIAGVYKLFSGWIETKDHGGLPVFQETSKVLQAYRQQFAPIQVLPLHYCDTPPPR